MTVYEQSDGFVPNKQTPPATSKLGASDAKFSEVHGTTVSGTTLGATNLYKGGASVPSMYTETVNFVAETAKTITHSLNNSTPIWMVYGSGTNELLHAGSGADTVVYTASGSTANALVLYTTATAPGSTVVIIG